MGKESLHKKVIALVGFMGTGKSSVGRVLAGRLGFDFIDLDNLILEESGMTIVEIFSKKGEQYFRQMESDLLARELSKTSVVIACGGGVVLGEKNRRMLKTKALVAWLKNTVETSVERCKDESRPLLNNPDVLTTANKLYNAREKFYRAISLFSVDTDNRSIEDLAEEIVLKLGMDKVANA